VKSSFDLINVTTRGVVVIAMAAVVSAFSGASWAGVIVSTWSGGGESTTDPFDVSQGTIVLENSPLIPGSDARSALGYANIGFVEPDNTYFADNGIAGATDFITFMTANPVTITGFNLRTYDDSYSGAINGNRGFTSVTLWGSSDNVTYSILASTDLGNSYLTDYGYWGLLVQATFAPTTDQYFRFEGTRYNTTGPRIVELDGIPAPNRVPEPETLGLLAVALASLGVCRRGK